MVAAAVRAPTNFVESNVAFRSVLSCIINTSRKKEYCNTLYREVWVRDLVSEHAFLRRRLRTTAPLLAVLRVRLLLLLFVFVGVRCVFVKLA